MEAKMLSLKSLTMFGSAPGDGDGTQSAGTDDDIQARESVGTDSASLSDTASEATDITQDLVAEGESNPAAKNDDLVPTSPAEQREMLELRLMERRAMRNYEKLIQEANEFSAKAEGFNLESELSDRRFCNLLSAGFTVEDAWRAVHAGELIAAAVRRANEVSLSKATESIQSMQRRPDENGDSSRSGYQSARSVDGLTGRGIRDILRRVENGAKVKF